jgi:hypothetical protein
MCSRALIFVEFALMISRFGIYLPMSFERLKEVRLYMYLLSYL